MRGDCYLQPPLKCVLISECASRIQNSIFFAALSQLWIV